MTDDFKKPQIGGESERARKLRDWCERFDRAQAAWAFGLDDGSAMQALWEEEL